MALPSKSERDILLRELEATLTPEEARVFHLKALGFSSGEIAKAPWQLRSAVDEMRIDAGDDPYFATIVYTFTPVST